MGKFTEEFSPFKFLDFSDPSLLTLVKIPSKLSNKTASHLRLCFSRTNHKPYIFFTSNYKHKDYICLFESKFPSSNEKVVFSVLSYSHFYRPSFEVETSNNEDFDFDLLVCHREKGLIFTRINLKQKLQLVREIRIEESVLLLTSHTFL